MDLLEKLTGHTFDGKKADIIPENLHIVYSIKDHLQRLLSTRKGTYTLQPELGVDDIPDVYTTVPKDIYVFENILRSMILKFDSRVCEVHFYSWFIEKKQSRLACKVSVIIAQKKVIRFLIFFGHVGNNQVFLHSER